jgi:hypothetical protein
MIKKIKVKSQTYYGGAVTEKIVEATCDICGADCMHDVFSPKESDGDRDEKDNYKIFNGMILRADWGAHSNDKEGQTWEACVCENCVDARFKDINFIKKFYM